MKLTLGSDVLGDDAPASGPRRTIQIVSLPGECQVQIEPLAGGANPFAAPRGNVSGSFVFIVTNTFTDQDDANEFLVTEYARIGTQANLVWARAGDLFTFADAILQRVEPVEISGVKVREQYTFFIRTVTLAGA